MKNQSLRSIKENIGIVIPAFNEENNIVRLIKKIKNKFNSSTILIVDDSKFNRFNEKISL